MKNFTKKYYMIIEGCSTMIDSIELTAKQFWNIKQQLDRNMKINSCSEDDEPNEFIITFNYLEKHSYNHTNYIYDYANGTTVTRLVYSVCDEGYVFKQ